MDAPVVPVAFAHVAGTDQCVDVAQPVTSRSDGFFSKSVIKGAA